MQRHESSASVVAIYVWQNKISRIHSPPCRDTCPSLTSGIIPRCTWSKSITLRFDAHHQKRRRRGMSPLLALNTSFQGSGPAFRFSCAWVPRSSRFSHRRVANRVPRGPRQFHTSLFGPPRTQTSAWPRVNFKLKVSRFSSKIMRFRTRSTFLTQTDFSLKSQPTPFPQLRGNEQKARHAELEYFRLPLGVVD